MKQKKILVPLGPEDKDLNALYHALSLAGRIRAKVFVLYFERSGDHDDGRGWWEEAVEDVIKGACEEGLSVSYLVARRPFEQELIDLARDEEIDLIVFSAEEEDSGMEQSLRRVGSRVTSQIIRVKEKNDVNYL